MTFQPNLFYTIRNPSSGLVVGIAGGSTNDGAAVVIWPHDGSVNQIFLLAQLNGAYLIIPDTTMMCLAISYGAMTAGTNVIQWRPLGNSDQQFHLKKMPNGDVAVAVASASPGLVFGVAGGQTTPASIVLAAENSGDALAFELRTDPDGYTSFRRRDTNLVLTIADSSTSAGARLIQYPSDVSADGQRFLLLQSGDTYTIIPKSSLKVLGISGGSTERGAQVVQYRPDGSANQRFSLKDLGAGLYNIVSDATGMVLGVRDGSTHAGAQIVQWDASNANDQLFRPDPVSIHRVSLGVADLAPEGAIFQAIRKFCPEVRLHPYEKYFPCDIVSFVKASRIGSAAGTVKMYPSPADLSAYGQWGDQSNHDDKEAYFLSPPGDWKDPILTGSHAGLVPITSGDYDGGHAGTLNTPMAVRGYAQYGTYWFDYSFFYAYNGEQILHFDYINPLKPLGSSVRHVSADPMATHIGDWEHAEINVSGDLTRILAIRVFGHGDPTLITHSPDNDEWAKVKFNGSHPVLYAGLHSHATYHTAGHHTQSLGNLISWGDIDITVNVLVSLSLVVQNLRTCDWCADGGAVWQAWDHLVPFGVEASGQALPGFAQMEWPNFYPHRWGNSRTFNASTSIDIGTIGPSILAAVRWGIGEGIKQGFKTDKPELTDGLGVSPPDWWLHGY